MFVFRLRILTAHILTIMFLYVEIILVKIVIFMLHLRLIMIRAMSQLRVNFPIHQNCITNPWFFVKVRVMY